MKENKSLVTGIIILAVVVIGYVLWVSYANKKVREVVDANLENIELWMESGGDEVTIAYDDVKVHSFSLRPRASVYKLHIKVEEQRGGREMHIALPEVVYTPKTFNMRSYKLEVLDSVTLLASDRDGEQESTLIDFSATPVLHVSEKGNGDTHYAIDVPEHISLTEASEQTDLASALKTDIAFASAPQVEWAMNSEGISLDKNAVFPQTTVTYAGELLAKIDGITLESRHSEVEGGLHRYATLAKLDNLVFAAPELQELNPISLVNDVTYTGPVGVSDDGAPLQGPQHLQLKNVAWMSGLMSVFVNGDISFEPEKEKFPTGQLSLRFDDVDAFLDYAKMQRPNTEEFLLKLRDALEQISGTTLEQGGEVTINIERKPNGRLFIGELSLEESLGLFIEMAMQLPDFSDVAPAAVEDESEAGEAAPVEEAAPISENEAMETGDNTESVTNEPISDNNEVSVEVDDANAQAEEAAVQAAEEEAQADGSAVDDLSDMPSSPEATEEAPTAAPAE